MSFISQMGMQGFSWYVQVDWEKFSTLRQQVNRQWHALPKTADVLSQPLKDKVKTVTARLREPQKS